MDFNFSEEQDALRASVREALERTMAPHLLDLADDKTGVTDELWRTFVDLGWTGLLIPEEQGGLGRDLVDMVVLQEELGRLPAPGPFFSSAVFATLAALRFGQHELLADLASGSKRGTVALEESGARDPFVAIATHAAPSGDAWLLDGIKPLVLDAHTADWVLVVARDEDGLGAFLVEDVDAEPAPTLDPTRKAGRLVLEHTPARRLTDGDAEGDLRRIMDDAAVLLAAELTGVSERALELATGFAGQRVQFGRPIGSFQAVKHKAAEMLQRLELARVGVHYAAWASDTEASDREQAAAMAKSFAAEAAIAVTGEAIQIHGAVGFTWENPCHLLYKRAKTNDVLLGQQGWQRQRVADLVLGDA